MPGGRPKGTPKTGGRAPGTQNRATREMRNFWIDILQKNEAHLLGALEQARVSDPTKYVDLCIRISEYCIPKLGRTELTGHDGNALQINIVTHPGGKKDA